MNHTGFGSVAVHRMVNWVTMFPSESISVLRQMVLGVSGVKVFGHQRGVAGEGAALGISCHPHPASQHHHSHLSYVE